MGSINIDHVYRLPHLPQPGETLAALDYSTGLGGKGANQSVAAARAGARVRLIGAIGPDGGQVLARLVALGVDCAAVARMQTATGHAIILLDAASENAIVIHPGANRAIAPQAAVAALDAAVPGDTLLLQNETSAQAETAEAAAIRGLRVVYSAAPFELAAVRAVLPHVTTLALNAVEAGQLTAALGCELSDLPVAEVLVTHGAEGADWHDLGAGRVIYQPAFAVSPVDTTGAGDTFAGYFAAARDQGFGPAAALRLAAGAAALKVTRAGAAEAIPARAEVEAFLEQRA
nr:PfkB family carbohydrate kinase [Phaeovulum veldkampii]